MRKRVRLDHASHEDGALIVLGRFVYKLVTAKNVDEMYSVQLQSIVEVILLAVRTLIHSARRH